MATSHNSPAIGMDTIAAAPEQPAVSTAAETTADEITSAPNNESVLAGDVDQEKRDLEMPGEDLQQGVQDAEAITLSWSKWHLAAVLFK